MKQILSIYIAIAVVIFFLSLIHRIVSCIKFAKLDLADLKVTINGRGGLCRPSYYTDGNAIMTAILWPLIFILVMWRVAERNTYPLVDFLITGIEFKLVNRMFYRKRRIELIKENLPLIITHPDAYVREWAKELEDDK
jgi:hypothetical protein